MKAGYLKIPGKVLSDLLSQTAPPWDGGSMTHQAQTLPHHGEDLGHPWEVSCHEHLLNLWAQERMKKWISSEQDVKSLGVTLIIWSDSHTLTNKPESSVASLSVLQALSCGTEGTAGAFQDAKKT